MVSVTSTLHFRDTLHFHHQQRQQRMPLGHPLSSKGMFFDFYYCFITKSPTQSPNDVSKHVVWASGMLPTPSTFPAAHAMAAHAPGQSRTHTVPPSMIAKDDTP